MISVQHLSKRYGDVLAVDDVSFTVPPAGVTAFVRRAAVANILMALVVISGQLVGAAMPTSQQKYLPFSALQASVTVEPSADLLEPWPAVAMLVAYALGTVAVA